MPKWPKVSVVVSTYKRPEMLREALDSILSQTYRDFEVLVVEDGVRDGYGVTTELMQTFDDAGIRLRYVVTPEHSGYQSMPKNVGISLADGSYIAYCDDDDLWLPHHLETLVTDIESGETDWVYPRFKFRRIGEFEGGPPDGFEVPFTPFNKFQLMAGPLYNFIPSHTLHSKAAALYFHGSKVWSEELDRFGDWELYVRSVNCGLRFRGVNSVTFIYRWHGKNLQLTRKPGETISKVGKRNGKGEKLKWKGLSQSVA